jgi:hypothetical protein
MAELRYTDTNSGDDSAGRAFGLEGNTGCRFHEPAGFVPNNALT